MLELKIDIIPHGSEGRRRTLETIRITNTGGHPDRPARGQYRVEHTAGKFDPFIVDDHDRNLGYWPLIQKIMERGGP